MLDVAHRGASGRAPEHTFPAYDLALDSGADALELDVHMTRDGALVVFHDTTLDRVAGRSGFVGDCSVAYLKRLDAGAWFGAAWRGLRIPTLAEVFERYGRDTRYYVETKDPELYPGIEQKLASMIAAYGLQDRVTVMSFSADGVRRMRDVAPELRLVRLFNERESPDIETTERYARGIGLWHGDTGATSVAAARGAGLRVLVYTVDSVDEMRALSALGVDELVTNFPGRLSSLRRIRPAVALR